MNENKNKIGEFSKSARLRLHHCEHCGEVGLIESEILHYDCAEDGSMEKHPDAVVNIRVFEVDINGFAE